MYLEKPKPANNTGMWVVLYSANMKRKLCDRATIKSTSHVDSSFIH
jgi:hypothetical protein